MYKNFYKSDRISKEIKKKISYIIQQNVNDPRINKFSTVLDVVISKDCAYAKIFISFYNENENLIKNSLKILNNASNYIRFLLGKKLNLRIIPKLIFLRDCSFLEGEKISNLLKKIK